MADENTEITGEDVSAEAPVEEATVDSEQVIVEEPAPDESDEAGDETPEGEDAPADEAEASEDETEEVEAEGEEDKPADEPEIPAIEFAETDELSVLNEKLEKLSEKYEMPEEVSAALAALKAKAESNTVAAFEDYGDKAQIQTALERENNLLSVRPVTTEDGAEMYRPNTDLYVADIAENAPDKLDWLFFDIQAQPSRKYEGRTKWEETNIDALAVEGRFIQVAFAVVRREVLDGDLLGQVDRLGHAGAKRFLADPAGGRGHHCSRDRRDGRGPGARRRTHPRAAGGLWAPPGTADRG